jgi:Fibronectin type III domain
MPNPRLTLIALVATLLISLPSLTAAQQSASEGPWSGWARCEINVSGQGYSDKQTHTWTISSSASVASGAFRVYPATWSVAGSGSLQHTQGTQTLTAQWATSAQNLSAPLAVFVRASDGKMFIQARHSQARAPRSVNGYQQLTIDGKPQKPGTISAEAFEWAFPVVEVSRPRPTDPLVANGSSTPLVNGKVGYMQPAGTQATASCTWQFGQGSAAPAPPPAVATQSTPTPPGSQGSTGSQISGQSPSAGSPCISEPGGMPPSATSSSTVTLTWTAPGVGTPASYVIEASSAPGGPANLANFNTGNASTSLIVPDVPAGTYYVRIRAVSSCGTSARSSEEQLIVSTANASTAPSAPRGLASSVKGSTVTLTWLAPDTGTATSYIIRAGSQARNSDLANFDTNSTALTLVAQNLPAGSYYIRVFAKNASGLRAPSNEVLLTLPAPPLSRKQP